MNVALVYDRVNKWGGAERVLLALHELFPSAPLYTSVYNSHTAEWAGIFDVKTSFLQNFPLALTHHESYAVLMPLAFESMSFEECDLVISVTSESAKGIITRPETKHICYCLTPTRYIWSGYDEYFGNSLLRFASWPAISYLRSWDLIASARPDMYIAISKEVQGRIYKYYNRDSTVIYPPVLLEEKKQAKTSNTKYKIPNTKYYLVVSRLVPYKRVDIAINACNTLEVPLVIVGTGSQESYLKSIAGRTIRFVGNLTDEELVGYYKGCSALIFCGNEDFGLTILEAQSSGKPVIAFKGGGSLETIMEGKTGAFFSPKSTDALVGLLRQFKPEAYSAMDCIKQAEKFSKSRFKEEFMGVINMFLNRKI